MASGKVKALPRGTWLLAATHLLLAIPLALHLSIWSDEASSLYTTERGLGFAFWNAAAIERQAPAYFWLLAAWRGIDGSIFFSRLLSIIFSVAAIFVFPAMAKRLLNSERSALLAAAFFALHPILLWASLEIRVYSLVILLSCSLLYSFFAAFVDSDEEPNKRALFVFVLLAAVSLYANYYLGFLLVGLFVSLIVSRRPRSALIYLGCMAVVAAAVVPLAISFYTQFAVNSGSFTEQRSVGGGLDTIWSHILTYVLPAEIFRGEETSAVAMLRLWAVRLVIVLTAVLVVIRRRNITQRTLMLAPISATIIVFLFAAYFAMGESLVRIRHASVLFPPLILFMASLVDDLFGGKKADVLGRIALPVVSIAVVFSFCYSILTLYPAGAKTGDWANIASYIEQTERPGQPIIVAHTYDALALPYHYHGVNQIFPDERFFDFDLATPTPERLKSQADFTISKIPPAAAEIWLIVNDACDLHRECSELGSYIDERYETVEAREFYRQHVFLLRKKS